MAVWGVIPARHPKTGGRSVVEEVFSLQCSVFSEVERLGVGRFFLLLTEPEALADLEHEIRSASASGSTGGNKTRRADAQPLGGERIFRIFGRGFWRLSMGRERAPTESGLKFEISDLKSQISNYALPEVPMLRSKLASSLMQFLANRSLAAKPRSKRLTRKQRRCGTEQLEVRQLLTGDFEWVQSVGGTSWESANDIVTDGTGHIYTVGSFNGTVDFDPGAGQAPLTSLNSDSDAFVTKSDSAGNLLWAKALRGGDCAASSVAVDSQGNLLITGNFQGTVDFDPNGGSALRTSSGSYDAFVVKLNSAGDWQWVRTFGDSDFDAGNTIAVDSTNAVYIGGQYAAHISP